MHYYDKIIPPIKRVVVTQFYNEDESRKYTVKYVYLRARDLLVQSPCSLFPSSRMIQIQMQMAERALELLALPDDQPSYILDIGWVGNAMGIYTVEPPIRDPLR